jgi:predicted site-specific integrase-resolvase
MTRLLDIKSAAQYLSIGKQTLRDWIVDGLLTPVSMPGSTIRDRHGKIIASASKRRIAKILIDKQDLDQLIEQAKRDSQ